MCSYMGSRSQEQASRSSKYTIWNRILWIETLFHIKYEFDNRDSDHITFKGDGKESFSFNRALVENLIETFETMQNIYSNNYRLKVYTGNCIIQLNVNPKDPSESFF